mmetsp:Transcript_23506/g.30563  ORF Transcript_23506/g.30563 Transcript_23506/m.30563 type:complete len:343 (+) Transcript_23506:8-1036(+)
MSDEVNVADEEECQVVEVDVMEEQKKLIDMVNANDMENLQKRLAADAVIRSVIDPEKSAIGRDKVMVKLREIGSKLKGKLTNRQVIQLDKKTTRCICKATVFGTTVVLGFEFIFAGLIVLELGLGKNPPTDFLEIKPPEKNDTSSLDTDLVVTTKLEPPFLIPRPTVFPPRLVRFIVKNLDTALISPYKIPRPINPYLRLACGDVFARTKILFNTKTPNFKSESLEIFAPLDNDILDITVLDYNAGRKNQWLARGQFNLPMLKLCEPPAPVLIPLDIRLSALSQEIKPNTKITLFAEISDIFMERWWSLEERTKRSEIDSHGQEEEEAKPQDSKERRWWHLW